MWVVVSIPKFRSKLEDGRRREGRNGRGFVGGDSEPEKKKRRKKEKG